MKSLKTVINLDPCCNYFSSFS